MNGPISIQMDDGTVMKCASICSLPDGSFMNIDDFNIYATMEDGEKRVFRGNEWAWIEPPRKRKRVYNPTWVEWNCKRHREME